MARAIGKNEEEVAMVMMSQIYESDRSFLCKYINICTIKIILLNK